MSRALVLAEQTITTQATVIAEGGQVAFVSCMICGAAIMLNPREPEDVIAVHRAWHKRHNDLP